jgi:hypothetical protein
MHREHALQLHRQRNLQGSFDYVCAPRLARNAHFAQDDSSQIQTKPALSNTRLYIQDNSARSA